MPTYQITTDKGTYQVNTESGGGGQQQTTAQPDQATQEVNSALNDFAGTPSAPATAGPSKPMGVMDQVMNNLAQFGKNEASVLPFAGRLAQLGGLISGQKMAPEDMTKLYQGVPEPQGLLQNVSAMAGSLVPQIITMTPFMKGAGLLAAGAQDAIRAAAPGMVGKIAGGVVNSPMVRGAAALGTYSGTKEALTGGDGQAVTDATIQGMTQGLMYGALTKLGASVMPAKIFGKYAETAGSAVGGVIAGTIMAPGGDGNKQLASALLMGGLAALTPEERFDFHKMVANNVDQAAFSKYMREGLQIPEADIKVIQDNGMNEVQRVGEMQIPVPNEVGGQDILTPVQIAQKFYQSGIGAIREKLGIEFDNAIKANEALKPEDIGKFVAELKGRVDNYADPTSPIVRRFNTTYNALQGFQPTTTETEIAGTKEQPNVAAPNPRKVTMTDLPVHMQAQVRAQLGQTGDITNLSLNALHELKKNMYDAVSDKAWKTKQFDPEERFAYKLGKDISNFIGSKNELYQKASQRYAIMKDVNADVNTLNTNNLGKDWARMAPANRVDMMNKLNGISTYFKSHGVSQFDPKGLLDKYHAYEAINNPDPTSFRNNAFLKVGFERGASMVGAAMGLPFGLHGAAIGGGIGYMTALHYMRPNSYIPILKQMKPNLKVPSSMNADEALKTLTELIAKPKAGKSPTAAPL